MPGDPVRAGREALRRRRDALGAGRSHLVETTLAGSGILRHMTAARREGYRIVLHYVSVVSPDRALDRIRNRVALGGHDIPEADVRRRFVRSHANLPAAMEARGPDRALRQYRSRQAAPGGRDYRGNDIMDRRGYPALGGRGSPAR